jgi:apolipoprotein D and lipocalin family protein
VRRTPLLLGAGALAAVAFRLWRRSLHAPLDVVPHLELGRYMGRWYEIGRMPSWFERGCGQGTATYRQLDDRSIEVVNACTTRAGRERSVHGVGRIPDPAAPARLRVAFGPLARGDYHVLYVDDGYLHAVVGEPSRRFGWILSRRPTVDDATWKRLVDVLARQGYDLDRLVRLDLGRHGGPPIRRPDPVVQAGFESFPASDPPSYAPGTI